MSGLIFLKNLDNLYTLSNPFTLGFIGVENSDKYIGTFNFFAELKRSPLSCLQQILGSKIFLSSLEITFNNALPLPAVLKFGIVYNILIFLPDNYYLMIKISVIILLTNTILCNYYQSLHPTSFPQLFFWH